MPALWELSDVYVDGAADGDLLSINASKRRFSFVKPQALLTDRVNTLFVAKHGSDANEGTSPEKPFLTISAALAEVSADGRTTVFVGPGIYTENIVVPSSTFLIGPEAALVGRLSASGEVWVELNTISKDEDPSQPAVSVSGTAESSLIGKVKIDVVLDGSNSSAPGVVSVDGGLGSSAIRFKLEIGSVANIASAAPCVHVTGGHDVHLEATSIGGAVGIVVENARLAINVAELIGASVAYDTQHASGVISGWVSLLAGARNPTATGTASVIIPGDV